ncbi:putative F-box protein At5g38270 [Hevea brasiliensis]|uniref:putative F-box protein At5g38270 n=1 Tax=Hevea brasiliensis TaxID=3981 RepID=UPI0025EAB6F1|nr:putative F-box protein At5g38270 [Hevea brasiliensis]
MAEDPSASSKRLQISFSKVTSIVEQNWSKLQPELLRLILSKLSFAQFIRFKAVCSSWNSIAKSYVSSLRQVPWLLLPGNQEHHARCFFSLEDNKTYQIKNIGNLFGNDAWCVGSSHGWLVLLDDEAKPFLLNPFSQVRIQLPTIEGFMFQVNKSYFIQHLRKVFITKAILLSDPSHDNSYVVVLIFGYLSRLAFCKKGDSGWTILSGASQGYCDIIYINDFFYALTSDSSIEVWDFHASLPIKKREIHPSTTREMLEATKCFGNLHSCQTYLVESSGDLLLVLRYIGNFVNEEGEVVDEAYLLSGDSTQPLVCPYQTLMFHVCKLDSREQKWVGVDNLKDEVLFLGGNHSMSLLAQYCSGFEKNSIYFTDDNWNQMNEDDLYGGHDLGKFSLEEKIVKPFYACDLRRIDPPPFWIVPNPW